MPELEVDPGEITENTTFVPYEEWHPTIGPALWKRLEVPGQPRNGSYTNPAAFDLKELPDGQGYSRVISHHERLKYWDEHLGMSFAAEHYLRVARLGSPNPKILEIGSWPHKNPIVGTQYDNTALAILSQNLHFKVAGVDNVDITRVFPYRSYTPPNFGNGAFINGDFFDTQIQDRIIQALGGKPHAIVGTIVFERRLGNFSHKYAADRANRPLWTEAKLNEADKPALAEKISEAANNFLRDDGVIILCNHGEISVPQFIHNMPLLAVYIDQSGVKPYVQVRKKI